MPGTSEGNRKRVEKMKALDPDYYKKMGKKGNAARKTKRYYFQELKEKDPEALKTISKKGGKRKGINE